MKRETRVALIAVLILSLFSSITPTAFSQITPLQQEFLGKAIQIVSKMKEEYSNLENRSSKARETVKKAMALVSNDLPSDLLFDFSKMVSASWEYVDFLIRENKNDLNNLVLTGSVVSDSEKRQEIMDTIKDAGNGLIKIKEIHLLVLEETSDILAMSRGEEIDSSKTMQRAVEHLREITKDHFE